jgi:glycosyltransferase involved in cell wall biosynthesis
MSRVAFEIAFSDEKRGIHRYSEALLDGLAQAAPELPILLFTYFGRDYRRKWESLRQSYNRSFPVYAPRMPERLVNKLEWNHRWPVVQWMLRGKDVGLYHSPGPRLPHLRGIRTVVTVHDLYPERYPDASNAESRALSKDACARADHIVTESEMAREEMRQFYNVPSSKVTVIPLAVDKVRFQRPDDATLDRVRTNYSLPKSFVLSVGPAGPHRNFEGLAQAVSLLRKKLPDVELVLVANPNTMGEPFNKVFETLHCPAWVHFIPRIAEEDLPALYSLSLVFSRVELYEGYGLPFMEAMACGVPCLGSTRGAIPEILGPEAAYADPDAPEDIARQLEKIIADRDYRTRITEYGREHLKLFSWSYTAEQTAKVYKALLA